MTTPTTLAEWEAAKERIDAERARLAQAICVGSDAGLRDAERIAARYLPYPSKPERTVTLGQRGVYRRVGAKYQYQSRDGKKWFDFGLTTDEVRLLASLLEEE